MWSEAFNSIPTVFYEFIHFKILGYPVYDYLISIVFACFFSSFLDFVKKVVDISLEE